ncbi:heme ABC exporter ATP-binding protein CcmA [Candidatus Poriferisodalis sp.]|uniref:heme ABC exporter ATP-binding protein CcmA n=1 Tax=Candidatus Poriferisodalis sp. TaxID=3101277 RepID=UPI003B028171
MGAAVAFKSVVALLSRFPALAGVDLSVEAGEMVCLRGPNGAGKTTLLRTCAGLVPLQAKRAEVLGFDLRAERRAVRAHVGLLGHRLPLYGDLRVDDQLRYCAAVHRATALEVSAAIDRFALGGRLGSVVIGRLSHGQQRRVALACLTIARPRLWLLDEPHAGLDASSRDALDELLLEAVEAGATVMFATHETASARLAAVRQVALAGGCVAAAVPPTMPPTPTYGAADVA